MKGNKIEATVICFWISSQGFKHKPGCISYECKPSHQRARKCQIKPRLLLASLVHFLASDQSTLRLPLERRFSREILQTSSSYQPAHPPCPKLTEALLEPASSASSPVTERNNI